MSRRRPAAVPDRPQRVVLYVRVSAVMGRGGDDFHSPEMQIAAMRRATTAMHEVGLIDDDIDQTGRTFSRAGIEKIRNLAEAGAIDAVAVYNVSRFGRNVLESLQFLNWLSERGVTILSASEHIDTSTPSGRWMLTNMLAIAEMRSDEIGNEWSNTIHHRTKAGKPHGPEAPTGYLKNEDGRLVPHPTHGLAVTAAFTEIAEGAPVRQVARDLRAATGRRMSPTTVRSILRNRSYLGELRVGAAAKVGAHDALVDEVTWKRVQARLRETAALPSGLVEPKYTLSGLLVCGSCTNRANHRRQRGKTRAFCRLQVDVGGCTGFGQPDAAKLVDAVLEKVKEKAAELRGDVGASAAAQRSGARDDGRRAAALTDQLADTRRAMIRAADGWSRGRMDDRTYDATREALEREEEEQQAALDKLTVAAPRPARKEVVALADRLLKLWPHMDETLRNRALRDLIVSVTISPIKAYAKVNPADRIVVDWM